MPEDIFLVNEEEKNVSVAMSAFQRYSTIKILTHSFVFIPIRARILSNRSKRSRSEGGNAGTDGDG